MQATTSPPLVKIQKEFIGSLRFPKQEILNLPEHISMRANKLKRATKLGNLEKHKVQIDFQDNTGLKRVETTIWSITEKFVILKSNTSIPRNRIVDIKML